MDDSDNQSMKILVYTNRKGGVGKTGLSVLNAFFLAEQGYRVLFADLDAQGNSSWSLSEHTAGNPSAEANVPGITSSAFFEPSPLPPFTSHPGITLIPGDKKLDLVDRFELSAIGHFVRHLKSLSGQFDVCILDTAPGKSIRTTAALFAADFVISPVQVEGYSVQGTKELLQDIIGVQGRREKANAGKLVFLGMLPNLVNNTSPMHRDNLKLMVTMYAKYMLPFKVSNRTSIGEALADKKPVWQIDKSAAREAAKEVRTVMTEIQARMGLPVRKKEQA